MADFPMGSPPFLLTMPAGSVRAGRRVLRARRYVKATSVARVVPSIRSIDTVGK